MTPHFLEVRRRFRREFRAHHVPAILFLLCGKSSWSATICDRCCTSLSVNRNPAANSRSCPGVRIVTLSGSSPTRISSGSSAAR